MHRVTVDFDLRVFRPLARLYVVPPAVPGTFHTVTLDGSFADRPARMGATVVQGVDRTPDVAEGDADPLSLDGKALSG